MTKGKGFELIPRAVPPRQRSSFYKLIITEFLNGNQRSVMVGGTDRKPVTLVQGLRKVLETDGVAEIRVIQRGQEVFLEKAS